MYNASMQQTKRKPRSDRMHVIYRVTCMQTGEAYVGLTVCAGNTPKKAVEGRWKRHVTRALRHDKGWKLCEAIRTYGAEAFLPQQLEFVRGKAEAHRRETELKKLLKTELNTA